MIRKARIGCYSNAAILTRLACRLNGYCDAIADMFGIGYDAVYEAAYEAYIDSVNCTAVSAK